MSFELEWKLWSQIQLGEKDTIRDSLNCADLYVNYKFAKVSTRF